MRTAAGTAFYDPYRDGVGSANQDAGSVRLHNTCAGERQRGRIKLTAENGRTPGYHDSPMFRPKAKLKAKAKPLRKDPLADLRARARASLISRAELIEPETGVEPSAYRSLQRMSSNQGNFYFRHRRSLWAEDHTIDLINQDTSVRAVRFGASYAEADFPNLLPGQFEALVASTDTLGKRPDIIAFLIEDYLRLQRKHFLASDPTKSLIDNLMLASDEELLAIPEILECAIKAIEVKQSNLEVARCTDYGLPSSSKACGNRNVRYLGMAFPKKASIPHVYLDVPEFRRLGQWSKRFGVPLLVAQFCLDASFLIDFRMLEAAVRDGAIKAVVKGTGRKPKRGTSAGDTEYRFWYSLGCVFGVQSKATKYIPLAQRSESGPWRSNSIVVGGQWGLHDDACWLLHL